MNRAVSGILAEAESGRPISGMRVLVARIAPVGLEFLGAAISGDYGRFRITYVPLAIPADLTLLVCSPAGRLLYTEPVHRSISGAELVIQVEVPRARLTDGLT
ncbi:MAG TPA: hypothetical protein VGK74_03555 [Symbiobacteriaceae bacterium]|jgi:hypothetical protein